MTNLSGLALSNRIERQIYNYPDFPPMLVGVFAVREMRSIVLVGFEQDGPPWRFPRQIINPGKSAEAFCRMATKLGLSGQISLAKAQHLNPVIEPGRDASLLLPVYMPVSKTARLNACPQPGQNAGWTTLEAAFGRLYPTPNDIRGGDLAILHQTGVLMERPLPSI